VEFVIPSVEGTDGEATDCARENMAMGIQVLEVRLGDGSLGFWKTMERSSKRGAAEYHDQFGRSRIHFQSNSWLWKPCWCSRFPAYEKWTGMDDASDLHRAEAADQS
jgi:hypothetical protein